MSMYRVGILAVAALVAGGTANVHGQQAGDPKAPARAGQQQAGTDAGRQASGQRSGEQQGQATKTRMREHQPAKQVGGRQPVQLTLVTSPERITSQPSQFYGVPVSVHAQVSETYNPHVFTLEQNGWWNFGDEIAVVVRSPQPNARLNDEDWVTVVGTVRPYVRASLERDYDWFDALPDIEVNLNGRPVIVADMVRTSDGVSVMRPAQPTTHVLLASPGDIADVPGRFYGEVVSVAAEIEDAWSNRAFTLDEDQWFAGPDVLVLNPFPVATTAAADLDGEQVRVLGVVRPFVASEFEADYDWFDIADYRAFGIDELERRPVIVASSIIGESEGEYVEFRPEVAVDMAVVEILPRRQQWAELRRDGGAQPQREERGTTGVQEP